MPTSPEDLFQRVVDATPCGMVVVNAEGTNVMVNAHAENIFGYEPGELIGQSMEILVPERHRAAHRTMRTQYFANPRTRPMSARRDLCCRRKNGAEFPAEIGLNPVETDEGPLVLASVLDITHQKQAEAELHAKNEEMQQLLYIVSHDLKSPLVTVQGFAKLVEEYLDNDDTTKAIDGLRRIQRATKTMGSLIRDLLDLSRINQDSIRLEYTDVHSVIDEVQASVQAALAQDGATVNVEPELPELYADRSLLFQLFLNLVANAIKYGCPNPGATIDVGAETHDREIRYFVRDRGPGIALEHHQTVFRLFHRVDDTLDGSGMGLAIVSKVMQLHNGRTWIDSKPGQGATFWVSFPRDGHHGRGD